MNENEKIALMMFILGVVGAIVFLMGWASVDGGNVLLVLVLAFVLIAAVGARHFLEDNE